MYKLFFGIAILLTLIVGNVNSQDAEKKPVDVPEQVQSEVFYGKVHIIKKKDAENKDVVDVVSFELVGKNSEKLPVFILVFGSKDREQAVMAQNGKAVWIEGFLGFSGPRNFIYCNGLLVRQ